MERELIVSHLNLVAILEGRRFDAVSVDEGSLRNGEAANGVSRAVAFDHRVALLDRGIAEQADRVFLGAPHRDARTFDSVLPSLEAALLDGKPCGLGELLDEADEEADGEADGTETDQAREQAAAGGIVDGIEKDASDEAADPSADRSLDHVGNRERGDSDSRSKHRAHDRPARDPRAEQIQSRTFPVEAPSAEIQNCAENRVGEIVRRESQSETDQESSNQP